MKKFEQQCKGSKDLGCNYSRGIVCHAVASSIAIDAEAGNTEDPAEVKRREF
jgi:hypothetical protein